LELTDYQLEATSYAENLSSSNANYDKMFTIDIQFWNEKWCKKPTFNGPLQKTADIVIVTVRACRKIGKTTGMNDTQIDFERPTATRPGAVPGPGAAIFLFLFGLPFGGFGVAALVIGISKLIGGFYKDGCMLILFGVIFSSVGFLIMFGSIWGRKKQKEQAAINARFPGQPWMVRADWAAGKIKATSTIPIFFYLLWSFLALAISAPIVYQFPTEWHKGNHAVLIALIFPVAAVYLITYSFFAWRARRHFGQCFFEPAQTPTPIGGVLEGIIQTEKPIKLEHTLHLKISCIRREVTHSGNNSNTREIILWQNEKVYTAGANLPVVGPDQSGIPVHFKLPADQPECYSMGGATVSWRLEAISKLHGPGFHVAFEIPVFKVAGASVSESDTDEADPTIALQAPIEEVRRDEHSRIKVSDSPNGREFYFPAARNVGTCISITVFAVVFSSVAVFMSQVHTSLFTRAIFTVGFGLFGLLLTCFAFSAWFKSSRVTINSSGLQATNHYLFFRRSRHFNASDIERFDIASGTTSGTQTFWNIKLMQRASPNGTTIASDLANRPEADWLVKEMTASLGRG
jgi:hypothetical protein